MQAMKLDKSITEGLEPMPLLRDKPSTLKEAAAVIDSLTDKYTVPAMFLDMGSDTQAIINTPNDLEGVDIKLSTGIDSQWLQVAKFKRNPYVNQETRLRITRPTAAKIKQLLIDRYAPDYHPNKK